MAVRIYRDPSTSELAVWTSDLALADFIDNLSTAIAGLSLPLGDTNVHDDVLISKALEQAFPIAFKLSGYKAEQVKEQRTLYCGDISPSNCEVLSRGGRD